MVGPEDARPCSGRNAKLLLVPALEPVGQNGKMMRATGGFSGGVGAVEQPAAEEEEEEEEETPPPQLLQRYLAAAGGQLEPGLCYCALPGGQAGASLSSVALRWDACPPGPGSKLRGSGAVGARAPRQGGMTNGDSGFLPGQDRRGLEKASGLARADGPESCGRSPCPCGRLRLEGPGDEGAESAGSVDDWAAPLEDPLRSCCLGNVNGKKLEGSGSEATGSEEGATPAALSVRRTSGGTELVLGFPDVRLNSRNTFEVSRRQSAGDHLTSAGPQVSSPTAEQDPAGTSTRARRSGGFADFFARNLFLRTKELKSVVHSAPGWKLFGKVPPRENLQKTSRIIQQEYEARTGRTCKPSTQSSRRKNFEFEPLSTTALILEDRPS
ncbi:TBC1 domain family member 12 [Heterocephalus glaber]|uniref:TBC1 domain family member 12 n=1 Tax=Heterocephalus glaber TaxID=10181 RepID=G5AJU0_HETGA|nr:TBC1 domain family member 12 [Heterocephalus glaber]